MRRLVLSLMVGGSLAYTDNFIINMDEASGHSLFDDGGSHGMAMSHKSEQQPQKIIIDGVNPNSELGKALSQYVESKKPAPKKKVVKKKPKPKKTEVAQDYGKVLDEHKNGAAIIEAKEVPAPSDHAQKAAAQNDKAAVQDAQHGAPPPPPPPPPANGGHSDIKNLLKPTMVCVG